MVNIMLFMPVGVQSLMVICPNMVIMPLYGHSFLIRICKLALICINSESRHVILK